MRTDLFDYALPDVLIARHPPEERDGGRLFVVGAEAPHRLIREFPELVPEGALLVLNESRVRKARVFGKLRPGGGQVELLFLEADGRADDGRERWRALGRASKPLRAGTVIDGPSLEVEVLAQSNGVLEVCVRCDRDLESVLEVEGRVPLPPYLGRADEPADAERYQTVYAGRTSSVAAPTAGLHLTPELLTRLAARGVRISRLELAVGLGTFRPVSSDDLDSHPMHEERFAVSAELCTEIRAARERGAAVVAVGTTVVRALESAALKSPSGVSIAPFTGSTDLLIQPGFGFRVVDALLTNFHQPRSTLLALVSAFAGYDATMAAYAEALRAEYRFLSYGDAMWIPRRAT